MTDTTIAPQAPDAPEAEAEADAAAPEDLVEEDLVEEELIEEISIDGMCGVY